MFYTLKKKSLSHLGSVLHAPHIDAQGLEELSGLLRCEGTDEAKTGKSCAMRCADFLCYLLYACLLSGTVIMHLEKVHNRIQWGDLFLFPFLPS